MNRPGRRRAPVVWAVTAGTVIAATVAIGAFMVAVRTAPAVVVTAPAALLPASEVPSGSERTFMSTDSFRLSGSQLAMRSRGSVILVHGLGESAPLFAAWAGAIAKATTMNVIGVSLRGNGSSRDTVTRPGGADAYARDLGGVVRELKRRNPSGPVLLLASHGGLGIAAHFLASRTRLNAPPVDGVIALDHDAGNESHTANGRALLLYPRRIRAATALASVGVHWLDGTVVAEQSGDGRFPSMQWAFAEWNASTPHLASLLAVPDASDCPLLVVSIAAPPVAARWYGAQSTASWVRVSGPADPNAPDVATAISRWTAAYSADAFEPEPPKATQTLDVLEARPQR
jgi:hypothetical protein